MYSYGSASHTEINNSLFARNGKGAEPSNLYIGSGTFEGANNLVDDGSASYEPLTDGVDGNIVGTSEDPVDPLLSNFTQLDNGMWGYYLLEGSPGVDAGDNALAVDLDEAPLVTDALGGERILDGVVDIGALEGAREIVPGQTYIVTTLEMGIDHDDGQLSLLEALEATDRNQPVGDIPGGSAAEPDVIRFAEGLTGTLTLGGETIKPLGDVRIEGPGAELLAFDAEGLSRVFEILPSVSVTLVGLTVTGGFADVDGGGILCAGDLTLANCMVSGNEAFNCGGGIATDIWTVVPTLTLLNSALVGNVAAGYGGGIHNTARLQLIHCTLAGNQAASRGGGLYNSTTGVTTNLSSTVIAGNVSSNGPDVYGRTGSITGTHNLVGDGSGQSDLVHGFDGNLIEPPARRSIRCSCGIRTPARTARGQPRTTISATCGSARIPRRWMRQTSPFFPATSSILTATATPKRGFRSI